ncbi:MAG TPA: amidohydrolase [Bryobacteraceae bacterium]|nr:amidohydrolase [Bryobacteraceae bacterium]
MKLLSLLMLSTLSAAAQEATLAVIHARVWTGNPSQPWAEALAARGETILEVGSTDAVRKRAGKQTRVIDAAGQMLVPGFVDSHVHFLIGGLNLTSVQLRDAGSKEEFIARIKAFAATVPPGTWITGGDWDHQNWGGQLPTKEWIDAETPNHPVWINRLDGHMKLANSRALAAAGISKTTKEVAGGIIVRDAAGEPTGILKDDAMDLVDKVEPPPTPAMLDRALEAAMQYVAARGVTSVDHMGTWEDLAVFERAANTGRLRTRIYASVPLASWERLAHVVEELGRGNDYLRIGGLKGFVDGSLGSHTAAFLQPFTDAPGDSGLLVNTPEDLYGWAAGATRAGLQVIVHAIGDRAIRTQLDIIERVEREQHPADPRFRIEHAQHLAPADIPRFAVLGVIASMQPYHAIDDGRWAEKAIGPERIKTTYAFRSLLDAHTRLAFGSDWFVAPPTPLEGIYAAVTRRTLDGKNPDGWVSAQKITVEEALRAYTADGAYAQFAERSKGTLEKGKLADFVLLDRDLTQIPGPEIRDAKVMMTVVGGRVVFERGSQK